MYRCTFVLIFLASASNLSAEQLTLHVAPIGREQATGTDSDPYASIEQARNRIRELKTQGELATTSVNVHVHAGRYTQSSTLTFTGEDSGTEEYPITYRAVDGEVLISGGIEVQHWEKLTQPDLLSRVPAIAKEHVVCVELKELGVTSGELHSCRLHQPMHACAIELFANHQRLPRAQWPNTGWAQAKQVGSISWKQDRHIQTHDQQHAWAVGFWENDWSSSCEPIAISDTSNSIKLSSDEALRPKQVRDGARYRLTNILGELDSPGEWYVDEPSGMLVYWPVENKAIPNVSVLETVLSIYDSEYLRLEGFCIESARSMNVEIAGGQNVCLSNCRIRQAGTVAVHIIGGCEHRIERCEIACTGSSAVRIEAGDRATLESCDHVVQDCRIHDFCQHFPGGRAAVAIYGVGTTLIANHIHSGPDAAIAIHGNEHLVENNEIENVCAETDDSAAIHLSYDPTYRGNVIRKNFIHDLSGFSKTGIVGIYLDDFASGSVVENNLLVKTIRGIAIGGGRDNRIQGNVILDSIAPIQLDARGTTWASDHVQGASSRIAKLCKTTLEQSPIYGERYPELLTMLDKEPAMPHGNVVRSNTFGGPRGIDLQGVSGTIVLVENNRRLEGNQLVDTRKNLRELGISLLSEKVSVENGKISENFSEPAKFVSVVE